MAIVIMKKSVMVRILIIQFVCFRYVKKIRWSLLRNQ